MVAYSFRARFIDPILSGRKRQTIRAHRKRHARPGEELQLYQGMRTKRCQLIGRAVCDRTDNIEITFSPKSDIVTINGAIVRHEQIWLDAFARRDGFRDWAELREFWRAEHPGVFEDIDAGQAMAFMGVIVAWGELTQRGV